MYYPTKPENVPVELKLAVSVAEDLRERVEYGDPNALTDLSAHDMACYLVARRAQDTVDGEDDDDGKSKPPPAGDSSAFAGWGDD